LIRWTQKKCPKIGKIGIEIFVFNVKLSFSSYFNKTAHAIICIQLAYELISKQWVIMYKKVAEGYKKVAEGHKIM
jgi:hypothetical protein